MTTSTKSETAAKKDVAKLQRAIVDGLEDVKAQDIQVFNTEHLSPLFERVIVASGTSNRQTKALASSVRDAVKEAGFPKPRIEGEDNGEWIIVDCGSAVAHIMQPAIRQYYRLEELWGDTPVRLKLGAAKPSSTAAADLADKKSAQKAAKSDAKTAAKKAPAKKAAAAPSAPARWQGHGEGCGKDCCQSCTRKNCGGQTGCKDHRRQTCQQNRWHCRRQEARSRQDSREDRGRQAGRRQEACSQEVSCRQGPCTRSRQACCQSSPQGCGQARCQEGTGPQGLMALPLRTHRVGAQCVGISHIQVDP